MNLISGMVLVTKETGYINYLVATPYGYKVIDFNGYCNDLEIQNYERAYIPEAYDDLWTPLKGTEIVF